MTNFMIDPNEFSYILNMLLMVQNYNSDKILQSDSDKERLTFMILCILFEDNYVLSIHHSCRVMVQQSSCQCVASLIIYRWKEAKFNNDIIDMYLSRNTV